MTRKDVALALTISVAALLLYVGGKTGAGRALGLGDVRDLGAGCAAVWVRHGVRKIVPNAPGR